MLPGLRAFAWDGRLESGATAPQGNYIVQIAIRDPSRRLRYVTAQLALASAVSASPSFHWPVVGAITSGFGPRDGRMHDGIDIPALAMTPVVATTGGTVRTAGIVDGYGLTVIIDHLDGSSALYAHEASLTVAPGAIVTAGQVIGYVGRTGSATTEQVHFELHDATGSPIDPVPWLQSKLSGAS